MKVLYIDETALRSIRCWPFRIAGIIGGADSDNRFSLPGIAGRVEVVVKRDVVTIAGEAQLVNFFTNIFEDSGIVRKDDDLNVWLTKKRFGIFLGFLVMRPQCGS